MATVFEENNSNSNTCSTVRELHVTGGTAQTPFINSNRYIYIYGISSYDSFQLPRLFQHLPPLGRLQLLPQLEQLQHLR
jgi:hypothetical protein